MKVCPACGGDFIPPEQEPFYRIHTERMCAHCNHALTVWKRANIRGRGHSFDSYSDPPVASEEEINLFLAGRVRYLAERRRKGKSILRCEWVHRHGHQCRSFQAQVVSGVGLCAGHVKKASSGRTIPRREGLAEKSRDWLGSMEIMLEAHP